MLYISEEVVVLAFQKCWICLFTAGSSPVPSWPREWWEGPFGSIKLHPFPGVKRNDGRKFNGMMISINESLFWELCLHLFVPYPARGNSIIKSPNPPLFSSFPYNLTNHQLKSRNTVTTPLPENAITIPLPRRLNRSRLLEQLFQPHPRCSNPV